MPNEMMSNKISNVLGVALPLELRDQIDLRSKKNALDIRDNANITYLANKTCWVRLVSSIKINDSEDLKYFQQYFPTINLKDPDSLAKAFVLFAGTSYYDENVNKNTYKLRSGITSNNSAYSPLGNIEIQNRGYRPMPGITDVKIETLGKLGSIRSATVNFKVWDKEQLDVIDALYFKMGYSMFLEWGHTAYYKIDYDRNNSEKLITNDLEQIDPFNIKNKETLLRQISKKIADSQGNYDAMLGMCTTFNFTFNQEGGYDCSIKLISLGSLAESIKINQSQTLPPLLKTEIQQLVKTAEELLRQKAREEELQRKKEEEQANAGKPTEPVPVKIMDYLYQNGFTDQDKLFQKDSLAIQQKNEATTIIIQENGNKDSKPGLYDLKLASYLPSGPDNFEKRYESITLDKANISKRLSNFYDNVPANTVWGENTNKLKAAYRYIQSTSTQGGTFTDYAYGFWGAISGIGQPNSAYIWKIETEGISNTEVFLDTKTGKEVKASDGMFIANNIIGSWVNQTASDPKPNDIEITIHNTPFPFKVYDIEPKFSGVNNPDHPLRTPSNKWFEIKIKKAFSIATPKLGPNKTKTVETTQGPKVEDIPNSGDRINKIINYAITFYDTGIISDLTLKSGFLPFADYVSKLKAQDQKTNTVQESEEPKLDLTAIQAEEAVKYNSGLEFFLRTLQLHAINKTGLVQNLDKVITVTLAEEPEFTKQLFQNGIFSDIIGDLIGKNSAEKKRKLSDIDESRKSQKELCNSYATYGFNNNLMAKPSGVNYGLDIPQIEFKELLKAYVIPYTINQSIIKDVDTNHPVYINLGFLLMILNHMCIMYDSKEGKSVNKNEQVPIIYIDFNPETNFCLSEPLHMSTDVFKFLIQFRGSDSEYATLFDQKVIIGDKIAPPSGSTDGTKLFQPQTQDFLSGQLPEFKGIDIEGGDAYRGKIMNILVNIDYILSLCKSFTTNDDSHSVKLNDFLQQILTDLNKYTGNINLFTLAYNDNSNCLYIVDNQITPLAKGEVRGHKVPPSQPSSDLPLFGKYSIAKSLDIKTEISNKLGNMLAISANSDIKSNNSTDGTPFGHLNKNYLDRFKIQVVSIGASSTTGSQDTTKPKVDRSDADIAAANMFNTFVQNNLQTTQPNAENISQATNYYIDRMNNRKGENEGTRASAMIPISVNFSTDGISGFSIGHAFTLPSDLMPRSYYKDFEKSNDKGKIGFVITGLSNTLQGNTWTTEVRANMMYLKDENQFKPASGSYNNIKELADGNFIVVTPEDDIGGTTTTSSGCSTKYPELKIDNTFTTTLLPYSVAAKYLNSKYPDIAKAVFAILTAEAAKEGSNFRSAGGRNYAGVQTDNAKWGFSNFTSQFCRRDSGGKDRMFAVFPTDEAFMDFMANRVKNKGFTNNPDEWTTTYINKWWSPEGKSSYVKGTQIYNEKLSIFTSALRTFNSIA